MALPITLYTYALSPYGMKVYWALAFKKLPFQLRYVHPRTQCEIAFTNQNIVPVVRVGEDWKLDSGTICRWLDELFPEIYIAGDSKESSEAIIEADEWVTRNVIGLSFRSIVDDDSRFSAFRNGRVLSRTMRATSGGVPWWSQFMWFMFLRRVPFVQRDASQVDRSIPVAACRQKILEELERCLEKTGYLARSETPSYADISLFAQLACNTTLRFEGALTANSSSTLRAYYNNMVDHFDLSDSPELVPGWSPLTIV